TTTTSSSRGSRPKGCRSMRTDGTSTCASTAPSSTRDSDSASNGPSPGFAGSRTSVRRSPSRGRCTSCGPENSLGPLHFVPEPVQNFESRFSDVDAALGRELLDGREAVAEFLVRLFQCLTRLDAQLTGEVDDGEQQVADFLAHP